VVSGKQHIVRAREAALKALVRHEEDQAFLNLILPGITGSLPVKEKALAVQLASGTIQRLNTLDWVLNLFSKTKIEKLTPWIRNLLRLSAYQLLYLDRVPAYAAIDEAVRLSRRYGHKGVAGLVNAVLRRLEKEKDLLPWPEAKQNPVAFLSLRYSLPPWLAAKTVKRFGFERAETWARAVNLKPALSVRPNILRTSPEEVIDLLRKEGCSPEPSPLVPGMIRIVSSGYSPPQSNVFQQGLITVQGESSALVAPLLGVEPGAVVTDLCSSPGGKTTHIAELMSNEGLVYAVEIHSARLRLVEKAAVRLGIDIIRAIKGDGRLAASLNLGSTGAVLVDAPCSGLGVIGRLPEIKWRRLPGKIPAFQKEQLALLYAAASILPPGGRLLYSVCSTEPEETSDVVSLFNQGHGEFIEEPVVDRLPEGLREKTAPGPAHHIWPDLHGLDGFFIALWRRR